MLNIKSVRFDNELPDNVVFHNVKSLDEIRLLTNKYIVEANKEYLESIPLPAWVGIESDYDHDCDTFYIHKIEDLKQAMSKTIESFNKLLKEIE